LPQGVGCVAGLYTISLQGWRIYPLCSYAFDNEVLQGGFQKVAAEEIFYISNPGLGLWAYKERFAA
jgi:hypothetical protein